MDCNCQFKLFFSIIDKLGERGIIPSEFAKSIRGMAGLRNILVHEYVDLDLKKIYEILQNRLGDFYNFMKYVNRFISREEIE